MIGSEPGNCTEGNFKKRETEGPEHALGLTVFSINGALQNCLPLKLDFRAVGTRV
jgi:hypothetical protein